MPLLYLFSFVYSLFRFHILDVGRTDPEKSTKHHRIEAEFAGEAKSGGTKAEAERARGKKKG